MKNKGFIIGATIIIIILLFSMCDSGSSTSNTSQSDYNSYGYSGKYGQGSEYDKNVNDIADAYGLDPDYVNDKINAVADEMN